MPRSAILALLLLAGLFTLPASHAQSGIHRCVGSDGQLIFTDRGCGDLQATESVAQPGSTGETAANARVVRTCARKPEDLLFEVRSALEAQDVNRLAGAYLWTGMGTHDAYSLLDRLNAFSARPLVDAQLVFSAPDLDAPPPILAQPANSAEQSLGIASSAPTAPAPAARAPDLIRVDLIRVDQMRSARDASSQTSYFRIVAAAGCLWIEF